MRRATLLRLIGAAVTVAVAGTSTAQTGDAPLERPARLVREPEGTQPANEANAEPKPVYDEKADATEQIAAAVAQAKKDNKRVLIQWGANWCGWCHLLDKTFTGNEQVRRTLLYEYELVHVDIGQFDKNLDVAAKYGADFKSNGVPYLTVLDADGNALANQETGALETHANGEPGHDPAKVLAFLKKHQAAPLNAEQVLSEAMQEAEREDKRVFVHFGAPWCGWCHRLEAWLAEEDVAKTLAKDFIEVKIDTDRMTGGAEALQRYTGGKQTGIPYSLFLEPDGSVVAAVVNEKGENLGCPWSEEELAAFGSVLNRVCRTINEKERAALLDALRARRDAAKDAGN